MKKMYGICFLIFAFTLCLLLNACVPALNMKTEALTKGDMKRGSVVVGTVSNKRSDDNGGKSFQLLGKVRGGYGNPFDLKADSGRELDVILKEVAKASLEHTGYSTNQGAGNASRLDIEVLNFWCDGYQGYKVEAEIAAKLVNPASGKILAQKVVNAKNEFFISMGAGPLHKAYDELMNDIQKELVAFMKSQEFQSAVTK